MSLDVVDASGCLWRFIDICLDSCVHLACPKTNSECTLELDLHPKYTHFVLGLVVLTLYRRTTHSNFTSSSVINAAAKQLTKTAIMVTIIFIVSLGFDMWYYILAYTGVTTYVLGSPIQVRVPFRILL